MTNSSPEPSSPRPSLAQALVPVVFLIAFLGLGVVDVAELPEIAGISPLLRLLAQVPWIGSLLEVSLPVHIPLAAAAGVASLMALHLGIRWREIERSYFEGIRIALGACLILLVIGMLIGTWVAGGIVPTMIHYGLRLLSPAYFLLAACALCAVVSVSTGSSWTTAGTVGIALLGIGEGMGLPLPVVAGAVISGAYFGDKMSPLSDTTNLAPAVVGVDIFSHIRHMLLTSGPSFAIACFLYWLLGRGYAAGQPEPGEIERMLGTLDAGFVITPWLFVAPLAVFGLVVMRVAALPALAVGAVIGGLLGASVQGLPLTEVITAAQSGYEAATGDAPIDELLSRGGLENMLSTIAIILLAMCFGGVMERSGMLGVIALSILRLTRGTGSLVLATLATCAGTNVIAPDQYLSLVVPGRMFREAYERAGLAPVNLSRCLEDGGTLSSPLVPWNTCGAYMYATLGVFPLAYLPFAFFNLLNPLISLLYGITGWTMKRAEPGIPPAGNASPEHIPR